MKFTLLDIFYLLQYLCALMCFCLGFGLAHMPIQQNIFPLDWVTIWIKWHHDIMLWTMPIDKPFNCTSFLMVWSKVLNCKLIRTVGVDLTSLHAFIFHLLYLLSLFQTPSSTSLFLLLVLVWQGLREWDAVSHWGVDCRLGRECRMLFRICEWMAVNFTLREEDAEKWN